MIMPTGSLTGTSNAPRIDRCRAVLSPKRSPNAVCRIGVAGLPAGFDLNTMTILLSVAALALAWVIRL